MRKSLLTLALLGGCAIPMQAQFQLTNSKFNGNWPSCTPWNGQGNTTKAGTQPEGWTVSNVVAHVMITVPVTVSSKESRNKNDYYVKLTNNENSGNRIPAYLSLGTTWATAQVSTRGGITVSNADGGTWGGIKFTKHPDAISFDYQRDNSNGTERASVIAYLWKGTYTQKDVPTTTAKTVKTVSEMLNRDRQVLNKSFERTQGGARSESTDAALFASAEHYITESTKGNWVNNCVVELNYGDYTNKDVTPEMFNIIFSANDYFADRSSIVKGNSLSVDNVKLLYYHSLTDITYGGKSISKTSDASDTDYTLTVKGKFDASKIGYTKKGQGATVTPEKVDDNTYKLVVKAEDYDATTNPNAQTTYTIHIAEEYDYTNDLTVGVSMDGSLPNYVAPQSTTIQLVKETNGSYTFNLNNFMLGSGEDAEGVGNIKVTNLTKNGNNYTASKKITITKGDDPSVDYWMGPDLNEIPVNVNANVEGNQMTASISISFDFAGTKQDINVTFAPTTKISDDATLTTTEGLANIVMTRTFKKGWNTICLPFAADVEALGATKAQAFQSSENGALNFASISDKSLSANVPYLVFFENESDDPFIYGGNVEVTAPKAQTFGGYTFTGNYQVGFSMNGLYGVADKDGVQRIMSGGEGATLGPCRAYFQTSKAGANGMLISFDGQTTGITAAELNAEGAAEDAPIYNLQGVRVNHLTKGVYIKGGKKIIVK